MTSPTHLTRDGIGDVGLERAQSKQFLDTDGDGLHTISRNELAIAFFIIPCRCWQAVG
jgi:hypothetical protein